MKNVLKAALKTIWKILCTIFSPISCFVLSVCGFEISLMLKVMSNGKKMEEDFKFGLFMIILGAILLIIALILGIPGKKENDKTTIDNKMIIDEGFMFGLFLWVSFASFCIAGGVQLL